MILKLYFRLLTVLLLNMLTLQNPTPVVESDAPLIANLDSESFKFKETENRINNAGSKRHVTDEIDYQNHQGEEYSERSKRLEHEATDVKGENQFYKPINEEVKENQPLGSKQELREKYDRKLEKDPLVPIKSAAARPQQKVESINKGIEEADISGGNGHTLNEVKRESNDETKSPAFDSRQRTGRKSEELGSVESHRLRSEAMNTIKKINPFTIGDQVAQMIHSRKCNFKNTLKDKSKLISNEGALQHEDQVGFQQDSDDVSKQNLPNEKPLLVYNRQNFDKNSKEFDNLKPAYVRQHAVDEKQRSDKQNKFYDHEKPTNVKKYPHYDKKSQANVKQQPAYETQPLFYEKQQPPKIVHKPYPSNDYGFSVIITTGDSQISKGSKDVKDSKAHSSVNRKAKEDKESETGSKNEFKDRGTSIDTNILNSVDGRLHTQEASVEKNPNANVEFPVYDQDLSCEPDPYNGLLDHNYWSDNEKKGHSVLLPGTSQAFPNHNIHARSAHKKGDNTKHDKGSSKKGNRNGEPDKDNSEVDTSRETWKNGGNETQNNSLLSELSTVPTEDATLDDSSTDEMEEETLSNLEPFADLNIDMNKTSCISYKEPGKSNNMTVMYKQNVTR